MSEVGQSRRFGRRRLLPVFPDKQTSRTETGTSEKCQEETHALHKD
jgi:hypothetical protein